MAHRDARVNFGQAWMARKRKREGKKIICYRIDEIIDITGSLARVIQASVLNACSADASRASALTRV